MSKIQLSSLKFIAGFALAVCALGTLYLGFVFYDYRKSHDIQLSEVQSASRKDYEMFWSDCVKDGKQLFSLIECMASQIDSHAEAKRGNYDLKAQQEMAEWAFGLLILTAVGTIASIFGLFALYASLMQTRTAIRNGVLVHEMDMRPWLSFDEASIINVKIDGDDPELASDQAWMYFSLKVGYRNAGRSPALNVSISSVVGTRTKISSMMEQLLDPNYRTLSYATGMLAPNAGDSISIGLRSEIKKDGNGSTGGGDVCLMLRMWYSSVTGAEYFTAEERPLLNRAYNAPMALSYSRLIAGKESISADRGIGTML